MAEALDRLERSLSNQPQTKWGAWHCQMADQLLLHTTSGYVVDLTALSDSSSVLDIVVQVSIKRWATSEDIGDLVCALNGLLDLQRVACGQGQSRTFNTVEILRACNAV